VGEQLTVELYGPFSLDQFAQVNGVAVTAAIDGYELAQRIGERAYLLEREDLFELARTAMSGVEVDNLGVPKHLLERMFAGGFVSGFERYVRTELQRRDVI
jgi:hypothetical protein